MKISNEALEMIAEGEPSWSQGEIGEEMTAMLVTCLPDICMELLARRGATFLDLGMPYPNPRNTMQEIANARAAEAQERRERSTP